MNLRRKRRSGGFTLIEVLLVLVILVVLASLAAVSYTGMHEKALKNAAKTEIETITQACELYHSTWASILLTCKISVPRLPAEPLENGMVPT